MGKRGLVALLDLSSWCLVMVERLFLAVPRGCLRFVIVVFPDHTHLLLPSANITQIKDIYRGSQISVHVLLNLLNELGKSDKMQACWAFHRRFS